METAGIPERVAGAEQQLRDHRRRLGGHDLELAEHAKQITGIRIDLTKLVVLAAVISTVLTTAATALIVHYLTPAHTSVPAAATTRP